jgi:hypothetical protein
MAHTQLHLMTRGRMVALLAALVFNSSGCEVGTFDAQAKREEKFCKDPDTLTDVNPPLEAYEDQGLVLGYDRLVPRPNPRKGVDVGYSKAIFEDPASLEQLYYDASEGNERARWLLCIYEVVARQMGRTAARHLLSLKCQTIANCRVNFDAVPFSPDTESGIRLLEMMSDSFETTASRLGAEQALLTYGLTLFVGFKMFTARPRRMSPPAPRPPHHRHRSCDAAGWRRCAQACAARPRSARGMISGRSTGSTSMDEFASRMESRTRSCPRSRTSKSCRTLDSCETSMIMLGHTASNSICTCDRIPRCRPHSWKRSIAASSCGDSFHDQTKARPHDSR